MKRAMMMGPVALLALAGCVTDREKVELEPPTPPATQSASPPLLWCLSCL
ncbi:hypothetical protein ACFSUK_14510 [Sphingobium scionense]